MTRSLVYPACIISVCSLLFVSCGFKGDPKEITPEDIIGKWVMSSAKLSYLDTYHFSNSTRDSVIFTDDTTIGFTGNNDFFNYYQDQTFSAVFDDQIVGNSGEVRDSGTWSVSGSTLFNFSLQTGDTFLVAVSLAGKNGTFTTTIDKNVQPGNNPGDSISYETILATSAVKQ